TVVVTTFATANLVQSDSGFLAVMVMGTALANWKLGRVWTEELGQGHTPAVLGAAILFLLAARLQLSDLVEMDPRNGLFLAVVVLGIRPVGVVLATITTTRPWRERLLLSASAPHGVVAAGVATVFALRLAEAKLPQAGRVVPLTLVILCAMLALESLALAIARRALPRAEPSSP